MGSCVGRATLEGVQVLRALEFSEALLHDEEFACQRFGCEPQLARSREGRADSRFDFLEASRVEVDAARVGGERRSGLFDLDSSAFKEFQRFAQPFVECLKRMQPGDDGLQLGCNGGVTVVQGLRCPERVGQ